MNDKISERPDDARRGEAAETLVCRAGGVRAVMTPIDTFTRH